MKTICSAIVIVLLLSVGCGVLIANGGSAGDGICITISPKTLVLSSDVGCVTVHSNIPIALVDCSSVQLEGISPYLTKADARGELVAKFSVDSVKDIVEPGQVTLTLTGVLADTTIFAASDTITVKE
jgi:hypothetical protein